MLANTNILYLSQNDEEKKDEADFGWKVKELDKSSTDFSVEASAAEKLKGEVSNLYVFDKYKENFQKYVNHLKDTVNFWDNELKFTLINSGNRLRSFCDTYTSYYGELESYFTGNSNEDKDTILAYLDEIGVDAKKANTAINDARTKTKTYVDHLNEDKENLNSKVIPEIKTLYHTEKITLGSLEKDIAISEVKLAGLEKNYLTAVFGAGAAGAGLTLTILIASIKKGSGKLGTKVGGKLLAKITDKIGSRAAGMIGKGLAVISIVTTLVEIVGLATSLYYIVEISKQISAENTILTNLKIKQTQLQPEVENLSAMKSIFTKVTQQTGDTYSKFSSLKEKWDDIISEFAIMREKLKTVDEKARETQVRFIRSALANMNKEFIVLSKKLINSGMGLNLEITEDVKFIDEEASSTPHTIFTPKIKIPSRLYSSYNNLLYI